MKPIIVSWWSVHADAADAAAVAETPPHSYYSIWSHAAESEISIKRNDKSS